MGNDFPDQSDPVRFLPFYFETAARGGAAHELQVIGWSDTTMRQTVLRTIVRQLDGGVVQCRPDQSEPEFLRSLAPAYRQSWSGRSDDVYRRIRDTISASPRVVLLEDAHHLAPRLFRLLQGLFHDTPSFGILASGSGVLFERLWRAARGHSLLVYCRLHTYGVPLPRQLAAYLREEHAKFADLLRKPEPRLRLRRPD